MTRKMKEKSKPKTAIPAWKGFDHNLQCRAPLIERSGRFIIRGNSSEIDRQLKAMIAVEARMGRWPGNDGVKT